MRQMPHISIQYLASSIYVF